MGLTGLGRRHDLGDPQGKSPVLGQLAQAVEEGGVGRKVERGDGVDGDVALPWTVPPLQRDEAPAVGNRRKDGFIQRRSVDQPWGAIRKFAPDPSGYVAVRLDEEIGTEQSYELYIGRSGVRENRQAALALRELDRLPADRTRSTDDRHRVARSQSECVQGESRCRRR